MLRVLPALLVVFVSSAAFAAGGGGEEDNGTEFWFEVGNLVLLLIVLFFVARKPVLAYFEERRNEIQENIGKSERLLAEAQARLDEWEAKANGLDADVAEIKRATQAAADQQRDDIIAQAELSAERIRASAGSVVEREMIQAREGLRREAADMAVEMAARILTENVADTDRSRLVDEFIADLERGDTN